jgi:hypothetical protein
MGLRDDKWAVSPIPSLLKNPIKKQLYDIIKFMRILGI